MQTSNVVSCFVMIHLAHRESYLKASKIEHNWPLQSCRFSTILQIYIHLHLKLAFISFHLSTFHNFIFNLYRKSLQK